MAMLRRNFRGTDRSRYSEERNAYIVQIPKVFSFTTNPNETLNTIYSVVAISAKSDAKSIFFDYSKCSRLGLGASVVLDVVVIELFSEWNRRRVPGSFGGNYPEDESVRDLFVCMGMTKHLKIEDAQAPTDVEAKFTRMPLFFGRKTATKGAVARSSMAEKACTRLTAHLNDCFRRAANYTLSEEGQRQILKWAGEIITNAEEHSEQNEWYAISYMQPARLTADSDQAEPSIVGECQMSVFCFGRSIHESLSSETTPIHTRQDIVALVQRHTSIFSFSLPGFTEPDLWTLYALQDGVSRCNERPGADHRGTGTIKMITAFQKLGDTVDENKNPEMTLISGTTRILFNREYHLAAVQKQGGQRQIIAFNAKNDLELKPDVRNVHTLNARFPGTILSFRFFIDKKHLDKLDAGGRTELECHECVKIN